MALLPIIAGFVQVPESAGGGMPADTGWVAVLAPGNKAQAVASYANPGGWTGDNGMNIDSLANQVQTMTDSFLALRTALANNLRPNA